MRAIRVATRTSTLALWQTIAVESRLQQLGSVSHRVPIVSSGDIDLIKPIYELGVQGVFTKELDIALLSETADIAVHSLKDIPIVLAKGLKLVAVLERADHRDVIITKKKRHDEPGPFVLATSSIRRKAQWLERYPHHELVNVRGTIETRIKKLQTNPWDGLLMAKAALDRLNIEPDQVEALDWMLPAAGQGAIAVVCREDDEAVIAICEKLNHQPSYQAVSVERSFLHELKGGCSVPISAYVKIESQHLQFLGAVHGLKGQRSFQVDQTFPINEWMSAGRVCANIVTHSPIGASILQEIAATKETGHQTNN